MLYDHVRPLLGSSTVFFFNPVYSRRFDPDTPPRGDQTIPTLHHEGIKMMWYVRLVVLSSCRCSFTNCRYMFPYLKIWQFWYQKKKGRKQKLQMLSKKVTFQKSSGYHEFRFPVGSEATSSQTLEGTEGKGTPTEAKGSTVGTVQRTVVSSSVTVFWHQ